MKGIKNRLLLGWRFVTDLCVDAHAAVSFTAPILSIGLTVAKWAGLPIPGLLELSYAWAFLPLAIWFLVGYARRREFTDRGQRVKQLKYFYSTVDDVLNAPSEDFDTYKASAEKWFEECAEWIKEHMGPSATARFLDRTMVMPVRYRRAKNNEHNQIIINLSRHKQNLKEMIEKPIWDSD
jgi:hypothetical protein